MLFITFEGIEGCGKSTQITLLAEHLARLGYEVVQCREPGGTPLGESVRSVLLSPGSTICPEAEAYLFAAARAQIVRQVIKPALDQGKIVLCDRFVDSSMAYQGFARCLGLSTIQGLNELAMDGVSPTLTFLFDLPAEIGLSRAKSRGQADRIEQEKIVFHEQVRAGFLEVAQRSHGRVFTVDATQPIEAIAKVVWEQTFKILQPA